jgi:Predicted metal-binding integral membrane protein (DUF2182)
VTAAASPPVAPGVRRRPLLVQRRPQWWLPVIAAGGWLVLGAHAVLGGLPILQGAGPQLPGSQLGGSGHAGHGPPGLPGLDGLDPAGAGTHVIGALAMVAVMAPLISANVGHAALRSPRRARAAVTVDVVAGWALVWAGAAAALGLGAWLLAAAVGELVAIGLVTAAAVGWQFSARKRRSLARCDGVLAPPLDRRRSRRACRRYGVGLGRDCVLSCWALMALMAVAAHNPLVGASTVGVAWYERRRRPHHDPGTRPTSVVIAATGVAAIGLAYLSAHHPP